MNSRVFNKVPNTHHTGNDDDSRAGAFYAYRGDRVRHWVVGCMHRLCPSISFPHPAILDRDP